MMLIKAIALSFLATSAHADPDRVSILIGSSHLNAKMEFEESNPGVFLTWEGRRVDLTVGAYRNSYGKASVAATASVPVLRWGKGEASVFAGLALYPGDGRKFAAHVGDIVPLVGLQVRHGNAFAQIIPSDGYVVDAIVSFGLTFELEK